MKTHAGIGLKDVQAVPRGGWPWRTVADAMQPVRNGNVVHLDDDLLSVMRKMAEYRRDHLAVVDGGCLAGVIAQDDMRRLYQIRSDLGTTGTPARP